MRAVKILVIALVAYAGVVVLFESLIGYFQPGDASTLVITTYDPDGTPHKRVLSRLESDGKLYVAANHWPRRWYNRVLQRPEVDVTIGDDASARRAEPVSGAEHDRVAEEHALPLFFRVLTGFPPRHFVRLDLR